MQWSSIVKSIIYHLLFHQHRAVVVPMTWKTFRVFKGSLQKNLALAKFIMRIVCTTKKQSWQYRMAAGGIIFSLVALSTLADNACT